MTTANVHLKKMFSTPPRM